jgi:hypothetical protein
MTEDIDRTFAEIESDVARDLAEMMGLSATAQEAAAGDHGKFYADLHRAEAKGACMAGYQLGYRMALHDVWASRTIPIANLGALSIEDARINSNAQLPVHCLVCTAHSFEEAGVGLEDTRRPAQAVVKPCMHLCACAACAEDLVVRDHTCLSVDGSLEDVVLFRKSGHDDLFKAGQRVPTLRGRCRGCCHAARHRRSGARSCKKPPPEAHTRSFSEDRLLSKSSAPIARW